MLRNPQFFKFLTSKSFSRRSVVPILRSSTSKSSPSMPAFDDFDFQIAFAPQHGANLAQLPKVVRTHGVSMILISKSVSRRSVCKFWRRLWQPVLRAASLFGADFASPRTFKTMENIAFRAIPARQSLCAVRHLCRRTSMLQDLAATFSTYSRKLDP